MITRLLLEEVTNERNSERLLLDTKDTKNGIRGEG